MSRSAKGDPKARKKPTPLSKNAIVKRGRPVVYHPDMDETVYRLALRGVIDIDIAFVLGISSSTFSNWLRDHPSFRASRDNGKVPNDDEVERALIHSAKGYSHPEDKILADGTIIKTTKHYPPNPQSVALWLSNRRPDKWRLRGTDSAEASDTTIKIVGGLPE